jgi:hypothetical protein
MVNPSTEKSPQRVTRQPDWAHRTTTPRPGTATDPPPKFQGEYRRTGPRLPQLTGWPGWCSPRSVPGGARDQKPKVAAIKENTAAWGDRSVGAVRGALRPAPRRPGRPRRVRARAAAQQHLRADIAAREAHYGRMMWLLDGAADRPPGRAGRTADRRRPRAAPPGRVRARRVPADPR